VRRVIFLNVREVAPIKPHAHILLRSHPEANYVMNFLLRIVSFRNFYDV
jgi:hypothetical protein